MANQEQSGSILDIIKEQTTNIEQQSSEAKVIKAIDDGIRESAGPERSARAGTVAIQHDASTTHEQIIQLIEEKWVKELKSPPVTYWADKSNTYAHFLTPLIKENFLAWSAKNLPEIQSKMAKTNSRGLFSIRKPIRIILPAVAERVEPEKIKAMLKSPDQTTEIIGPIRAGKTYGGARKMRSLMTSCDGQGFFLLFTAFHGAIPYNDGKSSLRLYPKVACKPWACRDCFAIGPNHSCEGKACGQCGKLGHLAKDCKAKTRFCINCKKPGHRAKDAHCPIYIREVIKEIRRMDIPIEFMEDKERRFQLVKALHFK